MSSRNFANRISPRHRERDEGLIVQLSLTDLAGVRGPGTRMAQAREGGQEHRSFKLFISASGGQLVADGRAEAACDRRQFCVLGEIVCGGKAQLSTSIRSLAQLLTPTPGMLVRTGEEGQQPDHQSTSTSEAYAASCAQLLR